MRVGLPNPHVQLKMGRALYIVTRARAHRWRTGGVPMLCSGEKREPCKGLTPPQGPFSQTPDRIYDVDPIRRVPPSND